MTIKPLHGAESKAAAAAAPPESEDSTPLLPEELLERVFGFLSARDQRAAASVCKTWRDITFSCVKSRTWQQCLKYIAACKKETPLLLIKAHDHFAELKETKPFADTSSFPGLAWRKAEVYDTLAKHMQPAFPATVETVRQYNDGLLPLEGIVPLIKNHLEKFSREATTISEWEMKNLLRVYLLKVNSLSTRLSLLLLQKVRPEFRKSVLVRLCDKNTGTEGLYGLAIQLIFEHFGHAGFASLPSTDDTSDTDRIQPVLKDALMGLLGDGRIEEALLYVNSAPEALKDTAMNALVSAAEEIEFEEHIESLDFRERTSAETELLAILNQSEAEV